MLKYCAVILPRGCPLLFPNRCRPADSGSGAHKVFRIVGTDVTISPVAFLTLNGGLDIKKQIFEYR
jgi:hypothetical protein